MDEILLQFNEYKIINNRKISVTVNKYEINIELDPKSKCLFIEEENNFENGGLDTGILDENFDFFCQGGPKTYYIENIFQNLDKIQQFVDIVNNY